MRWIVVLMVMGGVAHADTIAKGKIVKVEANDVFVDLGTKVGIADGARLRIKRTIRVKHPVTRKWVEDWLPIGAADVTHAGAQLSMAQLEPDLLAEVATGDVVEIYVERDDVVAPPPAPPPVADDRPLPAVDGATTAVLAVFTGQQGGTLDARIAAWEGYLAAHGDSPYAAAVREDLGTLRDLREQLAPPTPTSTRTITGVEHVPPTQAAAGASIPLVFVLADPKAITSAWLHYRTGDAPTYQRVLLTREHELYLRGEIPADAVAAPGVEYFVEAVDARGEEGVAIAPTTVAVAADTVAAHFAPDRLRTKLSTRASYLDFATFDHRSGDHTDRMIDVETDVTYALDGTLRALGAGFGILDGQGGLTQPPPGIPLLHTGFQYGYAETELAITPRLGIATRLIAGVDRTHLGFGAEGRVRIGDPDGTALSFVASEIARVGFLTDVRFQVAPTGQVPIGLSVGVTDRPGRGDTAVRLGVDVGLRVLPWLIPVFRVSYQGRTVEHSGLGGGLGMDFQW